MEKLRPKIGYPLSFIPHHFNLVLFNLYYLLVLIHVFRYITTSLLQSKTRSFLRYKFKDTKTFKMRSKVDINATDVPMNQNYNVKNIGETNKNEV